VLEEGVEVFRRGSVVLDDNARACDNFPRLALPVEHAEARPFAQLLGVGDFDEIDVVLCAEGFNQLDIGGLTAVLSQDTEVGLSSVEGFGALVESTREAVVD